MDRITTTQNQGLRQIQAVSKMKLYILYIYIFFFKCLSASSVHHTGIPLRQKIQHPADRMFSCSLCLRSYHLSWICSLPSSQDSTSVPLYQSSLFTTKKSYLLVHAMNWSSVGYNEKLTRNRNNSLSRSFFYFFYLLLWWRAIREKEGIGK